MTDLAPQQQSRWIGGLSRSGRKATLRSFQLPSREIPPGAVVHPLHWYKREKKRAIPLAKVGSRDAA